MQNAFRFRIDSAQFRLDRGGFGGSYPLLPPPFSAIRLEAIGGEITLRWGLGSAAQHPGGVGYAGVRGTYGKVDAGSGRMRGSPRVLTFS